MQLATIGAVIGAPPAVTETPTESAAAVSAAAPAPAPEPAPEVVAEPAPEVVTEPAPDAAPAETAAFVEAVVAVATSDWRDEVSYTLAPGEGIEVKLAMQEGQTARFYWTANGAVVNYDTHGDGSGQKVSYEQGRGVTE